MPCHVRASSPVMPGPVFCCPSAPTDAFCSCNSSASLVAYGCILEYLVMRSGLYVLTLTWQMLNRPYQMLNWHKAATQGFAPVLSQSGSVPTTHIAAPPVINRL